MKTMLQYAKIQFLRVLRDPVTLIVLFAIPVLLLVLFGADFKGWVEQRLGSIAGALRVPLMALLCLIGSGAALIYATPWVERGLSQFNNYSLAPVLLVVLVLIGVVADRR